MTDITPLSGDELNKLVDDFEASEHNRICLLYTSDAADEL